MKRISKLLLLQLLLCVAGINAFGAETDCPKREVRSAWVATVWALDWPTIGASESTQKGELTKMLDNFAAINMNAIYFQVRSMCDAMYKSSYEPWSSYLTGTRGKDPGWDPLAFAVEECHKRGMECHAWVNPYRFTTGSDWNTALDTQLKNSGALLTYESTVILNPALPAAQERIVNVCEEIAKNYDIDGIVFDDYFYPSGIPLNSNAEDYTLWKNSGTTLSFADWRRNNVNLMVKEVYDMIQKVAPTVKFGISPAGVAGTSSTSASKHNVNPCPVGSDWQYDGIFSDPLEWLSEGTIDYISPQLYWDTNHSTNPFNPLTQWWSYIADHYGRHHYASHSISALGTTNNETRWAEYAKQIQMSRDATLDKSSGCVFYSAAYISGKKATGLGTYLGVNKFSLKSLTPAITWKTKVNYGKVSNLSVSGSSLSWNGISGRGVKYSIYAIPNDVMMSTASSTEYGGIKNDYLIGVSYSNSYAIPTNKTTGFWYAVCVVDGYGNEFEAATVNEPGGEAEKTTLISPINNELVDWNGAFSWKAVDASSYKVQISNTQDFAVILIEKANITSVSTTIDLDALTSSTSYYWRVITSKTGNYDGTSDIGQFKTKTREAAPNTTLVSPANGTQINDNITFVWNKADVSNYTLQISSVEDFSQIAYSNSTDWSESNGNISFEFDISQLSLGQYYWRVLTSKSGCDNGVSSANNFVITGYPVGNFEKGYSIKKDADTYDKVGKYAFESKWMRSSKNSYNNLPFEGTGSLNRGFCVKGDYVYVAGRSENSTSGTIYLRKLSAYTGEWISDVVLSTNGNVAYYPCNDVIKDSKENICITNLSLNISSTPIKIFSVDLANGNLTEVASCTANPTTSSKRVDHCAVYGDVESGNFYVFAPVASSNQVVRWTYKNGTLTDTSITTLTAYYPSSATTSGIAPRILPIDENSFYLSGGLSAITKYNFGSGNIDDSFVNNTSLAPLSYSCNGGDIIDAGNDNFMVYPYAADADVNGYQFLIAHTDKSYSFAQLSKYWIFPKSGLGTVNSQTNVAAVDHKVVANTNNSKSILTYIYVPGDGLACYELKYDASSVDNMEEKEDSNFIIENGRIIFSKEVKSVEIYSVDGSKLLKKKGVTEVVPAVASGIYIMRYKIENKEYKAKIYLK